MSITIGLYLSLASLAMGQDTVPGSGGRPPTRGTSGDDPLEDALGTSIPTSVRRALDELRALHLGDRLWFHLVEGDSHGDSIYLLPDNRILRLAPFSSDLRIYTYNPTTSTWTQMGTRVDNPDNPHTNPQIAAGIRAILASRTERSWTAPSVRRLLTRLNARDLGGGNWHYFQQGWEGAHGDTVRVASSGRVIGLSRDPTNTTVFILAPDGENWLSIGTRGPGGGFVPSDNFAARCPGVRPEEITGHIQAILASRTRTGYELLRACAARHLGDGNWQYFQPGSDWEGAHGDTIRVASNGRIIGLSRNPSNRNVYVFGPDRQWLVIGTRDDSGNFLPSDNFAARCPGIPQREITTHIQAILASRARTGYETLYRTRTAGSATGSVSGSARSGSSGTSGMIMYYDSPGGRVPMHFLH